MFPNEKKRNFYLKYATNLKIPKIIFSLAGFIIMLVGLFFIILSITGNPLFDTTTSSYSSVGVNVNSPFQSSLFWGVFIFVFGLIYLIIGLVAFPAAERAIHKGEIYFPINPVNYSLADLYRDARFIDDMFKVSVYGNWIDVSYNWMNSKYFKGLAVASTNEVYTKMYRINPDHSFNELDLVTAVSGAVGKSGLFASKSFKCGRFRGRKFNMNFGMDSSGVGPHIYTLDTLYITNYMHKWFADRGYSERR